MKESPGMLPGFLLSLHSSWRGRLNQQGKGKELRITDPDSGKLLPGRRSNQNSNCKMAGALTPAFC